MNRSMLSCATAVVFVACTPFACKEQPGFQGDAAPANRTDAADSGDRSVDWTDVRAAADGSQILAYKVIARHADHWYRGRMEVIELTFAPDGFASDGSGNRVAVSPSDWKGILADARKATSSRPVLAFASKSRYYSDGTIPDDSFGTIARFMYQLEAIDDNTLHLHNIRKIDDGG